MHGKTYAGEHEIEFLPKLPTERYRKMNGERFWINYGPKNQLEKFRAAKVTTFTKGKPAAKGKPVNPDSKTSSEDLLATFDPKTGVFANRSAAEA